MIRTIASMMYIYLFQTLYYILSFVWLVFSNFIKLDMINRVERVLYITTVEWNDNNDDNENSINHKYPALEESFSILYPLHVWVIFNSWEVRRKTETVPHFIKVK